MTKILLKYFFSILIVFLIAACSELTTDIPSIPKVNTHGDSIYVPTAANYHVNSIKNSQNGFFDCQECHAGDFSGGVTGVGCDDCHAGIGAHQSGYLDPTSSGFHGNFIRNNGWDILSCQNCHGQQYAGKVVEPNYAIPGCLDCHTYYGGPENCTTCHGSKTSNAPPRDLEGNTSTTSRGVGAHQSHLLGNFKGKTLTCTDCHNVPGGVKTPGHIDSDNRAEVILDTELAKMRTNVPSTSEYDPNLPLFIPEPEYSLSSLSCANTYCHGYFKNGNLDNAPVWNETASSACGTCHGDITKATLNERALPKTFDQGGTHPRELACFYCHGGVVDANLNFVNPSKHIDGLLNLFGNDIKY